MADPERLKSSGSGRRRTGERGRERREIGELGEKLDEK